MKEVQWVDSSVEKSDVTADTYLTSTDERFEIYSLPSIHGYTGFEVVDHVTKTIQVFGTIAECKKLANKTLQNSYEQPNSQQ